MCIKNITSHAKRDFLINVFVCAKNIKKKLNATKWYCRFYTYECICSQMLSFFALKLFNFKTESESRIFRFERLNEKRVFYLSSSFSLLLGFLFVSINTFFVCNDTKWTEKKIISTHNWKSLSHEKQCIAHKQNKTKEWIQCNGNDCEYVQHDTYARVS